MFQYRRRFHVSAFVKELLRQYDRVHKNGIERNMNVNVERMAELYERKRKLTATINDCNRLKKFYEPDVGKGLQYKKQRQAAEEEFALLEKELEALALAVPNWSHPESPTAEEGNRILLQSGNDAIRGVDHCEWNKEFGGLIDFEGAAQVSGAHFVALKRTFALLELALVNWAVSRAVQGGFEPISVPDLVKEENIYASGFHPRQSDRRSVFKLEDSNLALAGTSEIYLAAQHANQIYSKTQLPVKQVAWSHCFRSEVGHHSAASRGLYRLHQFSKVELFALTRPEDSDEIFSEIGSLQQSILEALNLPFRRLEMHRGELGASAARKWDHEVWMPGRGIWGEVMSASNCTDYQSRRFNIRLKLQGQELAYPHTLNGTAIAVPRILMALIENGWKQETKQLILPSTLKPFMPTLLDESFPIQWS